MDMHQKLFTVAVIAATTIALAGCSAAATAAPTHTTGATARSSSSDPTPTSTYTSAPPADSRYTPPPNAVAAPTKPTAAADVITVTMTGTGATFTWTTADGSMHQVGPQDGPVTYTLPYSPGNVLINANVVSYSNADAACTATHGPTVIVQNTQPGQTFASCLKNY